MAALIKPTDNLSGQHPEYYLGCLKVASIFSSLPDEDVVCFCDAAQPRSYKKGQIIYCEKELANSFYVLCSGWIKLFHTMSDGEEVVVDMLKAGDVVGESAVFEHGCYTSSAQAVEDAYLLSIPASLLRAQIFINPDLALSALCALSRHHRHHYGEIALNIMQNAPRRVGGFLLRLCPKDLDAGVTVQLPYDKALIASLLGMKGATFSRALRTLKQREGVRIKGSNVEIDSIPRLIEYVYGASATKHIDDQL